jgi:hypothetical protein
VPIERREDCVKDLLYGLALHELAFGGEIETGWEGVTWVDDNEHSVTLTDQAGVDLLSLKVVKNE